RRSRAQGDRPVSPRRAETRRKAAPDRASAAPSSLASAANRVRATESPFAKAINGLLQQNRHFADITRCPLCGRYRGYSGLADFMSTRPSTTLADLLTPLLAANPFSAMRASLRRWPSDKFEDGLLHGWQ